MKNRAQGAAALINNFSQAEKSLQTALTATGSAEKENARYMDSIEGRLAAFKASYQTLSKDFVSSDLMKGVVSGASSFIGKLDSIISKLGSIPTLMAAISAVGSLTGRNLGKVFALLNGDARDARFKIRKNAGKFEQALVA